MNILIAVLFSGLFSIQLSGMSATSFPAEFNEDDMTKANNHPMGEYDQTYFESLVAELGQIGNKDPENTCSQIHVRKEFRDMSKGEWVRFRRAILKMMEGIDRSPKTFTGPPSPLSISFWTRLHLSAVSHAHGTPQFFPWHRLYIFKFEQALRSIDPNVTFPYWDWSLDAPNPASSPIWSQEYLGSLYSSGQGDCINFPRLFTPRPHCLIRRQSFSTEFSASHTPFYSSRTLRAIVNDISLSYDQFRRLIELAPHNIVHVAVGGPQGDMSFMSAPNDPIFWLHHTFIDKLWADHQLLIGKSRGSLAEYSGRHPSSGEEVSLYDRLRPFEERVVDTMDTLSAPFCYKYMPPKKGVYKDKGEIQRVPEQIPASWLRMHRLNTGDVRKVESVLATLVSSNTSQT